MTKFIALPVISLMLGFGGAWMVAKHGFRLGMVDMPNPRSSHILPTPRGGGIGMLAAFAMSAGILQLPMLIWLPAVLLSVSGFFDDRLNLSFKTRLILQFAAASVVISSVLLNHAHCLLLILFCVFIVGTANMFNFMDGINGIAGVTGMVGFCLVAVFAHSRGDGPYTASFAVCIAASCAGFLPLNIPKAKVFMGDGGSILLGFTFAALAVTLAHSLADFLLLCGFIFPFYADSLTTMYVRWRDGERLTQGHRRHLYQLLVNRSMIPHWRVSLVYGVGQAATGALLLLLRDGGVVPVLACESILFSVWCLAERYLRRRLEYGTQVTG